MSWASPSTGPNQSGDAFGPDLHHTRVIFLSRLQRLQGVPRLSVPRRLFDSGPDHFLGGLELILIVCFFFEVAIVCLVALAEEHPHTGQDQDNPESARADQQGLAAVHGCSGFDIAR